MPDVSVVVQALATCFAVGAAIQMLRETYRRT